MLETALFQICTTDSPFNTAIGGTVATPGRLYPVQIGQSAIFPAVAFSVISDTPDDTKDNHAPVQTTRVQFDIYADTYEQTITIASHLRALIDRFRGTVAGVVIDKIVFDSQRDLQEEELELQRRSVDYYIRINR